MVTTSIRSIVCLLLIGAVLGPVSGSVDVGAAPVAVPTALEERTSALVNIQAAPETDNTITRIVVHENGSATWTLQIRTRLETDESETEYRAFQDRFRENKSQYLEVFRESITGVVGGASEVTGREMRASGFRASTSIQTVPRRWGVVTYEFRWIGFAAGEGDQLSVGDVFEGGFFIAEGDALEVVAPEGYHVASADPAPVESEDDAVTWRGREDFADRRPQVVLAPAGPGTSPSTAVPWPDVVGGVMLLGVAILLVGGYRRWRGRGYVRDRDGGVDSGGSVGSTVAGEGTILADEDYVLGVLAAHDGRMRQKTVADELDWSRSKTSRVLGRMEEEGTIRKLQLGRENVIALPDDDAS